MINSQSSQRTFINLAITYEPTPESVMTLAEAYTRKRLVILAHFHKMHNHADDVNVRGAGDISWQNPKRNATSFAKVDRPRGT